MLTIKQFKLQFFDRAIQQGIDRGAKRALSRFGSYVWKRDKTGLKYRKGKSVAGNPPHVHRSTGFTRSRKNRRTGAESKQPTSPLRELTLFAYDPDRKSTVIGAALFARSKVGAGKAPRTVEEGGVGRFFSRGVLKTGHYAPHPHLGPAFRAELPKLPQMMKDIIK